ncbi:hypothetical protein [Adhaeribacter aquaticus]|uniref:hypothetical protein n=1 Tax=Adhaeribacter aquaticus TaxID=299567 RepID=UPI0003F9C588|nr:hypothetical protein [Adhaeribacter aquaticus]
MSAQRQEEEPYKREFNYGINFNTNAGLIGGGMVKSSRYLGGNWSKFWALEIVEVKSPKENRVFSIQTGNSFILGKSNYLYVLRPQYGREFIFFRKAPESGVQVNGILAGGPSIGLLVPYYVSYDYAGPAGGRPGQSRVRTEQYDPGKHTSPEYIRGSSGFLTGMQEANPNIGAHIKSGISFEYGRYREDVTGVEVGFLLEAYPNKMVLVPQAKNASFFTSAYLTLYYGRRK